MTEYREAPSFDDYEGGNEAIQNQSSTEARTKPVAKHQTREVLTDNQIKKSPDHLRGASSEFLGFLHELPNDVVHLGLYLKKLDQSNVAEDQKKRKMMYELGNIIDIPNFTYKDEAAMQAILDYKNNFNL
jgi:hypothetical protein